MRGRIAFGAIFLCVMYAFDAAAAPVVCATSSGALQVKARCRKTEKRISSFTLGSETAWTLMQPHKGPQGVSGEKGPIGDTGPDGAAGKTGSKGSIGLENCRQVNNQNSSNPFLAGDEEFIVTEVVCNNNGSEYLHSYEYATSPVVKANNPVNRYVLVSADMLNYYHQDKVPYGVALTAARVFANKAEFTIAGTAICCPRNGK